MSTAADVRQKSAFAPIRVAAGAFEDPRLRIAARLMRVSFEKLFVRLQRLWSWVTAQQSESLHPELLVEFLGRRKDADALASALCHDAVQLAERDDDGLLWLRLHDLFGGTEWYAEYLATAPAGGQARASTAARHQDGTFARRDIQSEILAALAGGVELRRCDLRQRLRCQKQAVCDAVKALLAVSAIEEATRGYLRLSTATVGSCDGSGDGAGSGAGSAASSAGSRVPVEPVPRLAAGSRGTHGTAVEPSAPAPAPAPAPVGEPAPAPARVCAVPIAPLDIEPAGPIAIAALANHSAEAIIPIGAGAAVRVEQEPHGPDTQVVIHPAREPRKVLESIASHYERLGRDIEPDWRAQPTAHRVGQISIVWRPEQEIAAAAVVHAIEMLAAEARERRKLGHTDPTQWYRAAWSPGVFQRALDMPNEQAARQMARTEHKKDPQAHGKRGTLAAQLAQQRVAGQSR